MKALPLVLFAALAVPSAAQMPEPVGFDADNFPIWSEAQRALPALPPAPADALRIEAELKGYVFGLRVIRAGYDAWLGDGAYAARSDLKTSGLGALVRKKRVWATTEGRRDGRTLRPLTHTQQNLDRKSRRVEMRYTDTEVTTEILPPVGSQGTPPASPAERFAALDTVSALLAIVVGGCDRTVPVFDSKQHYNLRLVGLGQRDFDRDGYAGPITRCDVYYEPVSGFDPEDLPDPDEEATPVKVWLRPIDGTDLLMPIRFTYRISGFKSVIKVADMTLTLPDGRTVRQVD